MTPEPSPTDPGAAGAEPGEPSTASGPQLATGIQSAIGVLAAILFVEILVFTDAMVAWVLATAGLAVLAGAALRPRAWTVLTGTGLIGLATAGIPLPTYLSLQAVLVSLALGLPYLLLVLIAGRLDPEAPPRPTLPGRVVAKRFAPLVGMILVVVLVPGLFAPVRQAWASDMAALLGVFLLSGTVIAFTAPLLVDRDAGPALVEARTLERGRRKARFPVLEQRRVSSEQEHG